MDKGSQRGQQVIEGGFGGVAGHVFAEAREELAHAGQSGAGGCGGAEDLGSLLGGIRPGGVPAGAGHPGPQPDVVVDDVPFAPPPGVAFAPDESSSSR
jgi:hypothetical protein